MSSELTFKIYGKDKYNNFIFISNEGKFYNENGNIINIDDIVINFDIEDKTPNIFDDSSSDESSNDESKEN
jgi:hypothetical protein